MIALGIIVAFQVSEVNAQLSDSQRFEALKNLDIYNSVFKEMLLNYVDTLDSEKITQTNIASMLKRLDPYSEYIPEEDLSDYKFLTTGEYGGIGSVITSKKGRIIVVDPYEGMPAAKAGLRPGDEILSIDGVSVQEQTTSFASERLRGPANTSVKLQVLKVGESAPKEIVLQRQHIQIDPVIYYGVLQDRIGYICLSGFTTHSAQSVKAALTDLMKRSSIRALILDVRDNGGGLMEECLEILNFFVPKGELLLSLKGKVSSMDRTYRATQAAIAPDLPMAVLVNHNSASASEILAGAIQDLDRGVIVGTRTYGKGLVQSTFPIPYDGKLKITTAKYYIPSGRSIQAIDYARRDDDGRVSYIPDSLTSVFYTAKGRPVRDGGGILPDSIVEEPKLPNLIYYLEVNDLFFDFVVQWRTRHPKIASLSDFVVTDMTYNEFAEFVKSKDFTYDRQSEKAMKTLKEIMQLENYWDTASAEFQALENKLKPDLDRDLNLYKAEIAHYLGLQIMKQYYYAKGQQVFDLKRDPVVEKALEVLSVIK
ncbi:MAG: S41 family peptidase [Dysgonamonadaceae bacterium]|jgi:carboxyl-terminal processing protease|nr:S41 family peptidase [Dysgonamonadaceae bacterium]